MIYNICTVKRNTLPGISRRGWLLIYHGIVRNLISGPSFLNLDNPIKVIDKR